MPLKIGEHLGPYEVLAPLGKGGMGEVYKGRDTRLGREVAIKVSSSRYSERFEREGKAIAALNHPNICQLYDVGATPSGHGFLVMELIEGPTLAERIKEGALPLEEGLRCAAQMAAALGAAHEKAITHRDLKPANVKFTLDGTLKVLDFGLAKIGRTAPQANADDSPTLTMGGTQAGTILGTAAYMAPEQARGQDVDKRADIFSFGVIVYEMVTGQRLFQGETISDTLAGVLKQEPDWSPVPERVRRLLQRCLEKDQKKRLQDIGDVDLLLWEPPVVEHPPDSSRSRFGWVAWGLASLLATGLGALAWAHFREAPPQVQVLRYDIAPPEGTSFTTNVTISPDGKTLAFTTLDTDAQPDLWVRPMDSVIGRRLEGSGGAIGPVFWSPDSRSIAFSGASLNGLYRIDMNGGVPQHLCGSRGAPLGAWSPSGVLVFRNTALDRVPQGGGECTPLTRLDAARGESFHAAYAFLPDSRHFLYARNTQRTEDAGIYVGTLDSPPDATNLQPLLKGFTAVRFAPSPSGDPSFGYLLFVRGTALYAQRLDLTKFALSGEPSQIAEGVGVAANGSMNASVSENGILVYGTGGAGAGDVIRLLDRSGNSQGDLVSGVDVQNIDLSPDGSRIAYSAGGSAGDILIYDVARGTTNKITFNAGRDFAPVWSPDGTRVMFASVRDGMQAIYERAADGTGTDRLVYKTEGQPYPFSWIKDSLYMGVTGKGPSEQSILPLRGAEGKPGTPQPFYSETVSGGGGQFSPDGRLIALASAASGRMEIYVFQVTPEGKAGARWVVSPRGGYQPHWSSDGKELFYIAIDGVLMSIPVETAGTFRYDVPKPLFNTGLTASALRIPFVFDVMPDGKHFVMIQPRRASANTPAHVVINWPELLKR